MDVEDAVRKRGHERGAQQPHVPRQDDEVRLSLGERAKDILLVRRARRVALVIENARLQSELPSPVDAAGVGAVRDDADDRRAERAGRDRRMNRFEVRAAARQENGELH